MLPVVSHTMLLAPKHYLLPSKIRLILDYKFNCTGYDGIYIGQTKRYLKDGNSITLHVIHITRTEH